MKKLLSIALSFILAIGLSFGASAASTEVVGSDDFDQILSGSGKTVSKIVRSTKKNYRVRGIYYAAESKKELTYVNRARREEGLHELTWDTKLEGLAIQRALELCISFSHTRPDGSHWRTLDEHINGENLAMAKNTYFDAANVTEGWLNSYDHYTNIMGKNDVSKYYVSMAAACVENEHGIFWVQLFHADKKALEAEASEAGPALTAKSIVSDLSGAAKASDTKVSLTLKNAAGKLEPGVIKAAADWGAQNKKTVSLTVPTLTSTGKSNQGMLTMNPANFTKNKNSVKTGVYVEKSEVQGARNSLLRKYPKASFAIIKLEQSGSYGGVVNIGAKADLRDLDAKSLLFYTYDTKTLALSKLDLGEPGYSIDKNNYLKFSTSKGGYIVVTDTAF